MGSGPYVSSADRYVADCCWLHLYDVSPQEHHSDMLYLSALRGSVTKGNQVKDRICVYLHRCQLRNSLVDLWQLLYFLG